MQSTKNLKSSKAIGIVGCGYLMYCCWSLSMFQKLSLQVYPEDQGYVKYKCDWTQVSYIETGIIITWSELLSDSNSRNGCSEHFAKIVAAVQFKPWSWLWWFRGRAENKTARNIEVSCWIRRYVPPLSEVLKNCSEFTTLHLMLTPVPHLLTPKNILTLIDKKLSSSAARRRIRRFNWNHTGRVPKNLIWSQTDTLSIVYGRCAPYYSRGG